MKNLSNLLFTLNNLTERNQHVEAIIAVAKYYNMTQWVDVMNNINSIHKTMGFIHCDLARFRRDVKLNILDIVENNHPEDFELINEII